MTEEEFTKVPMRMVAHLAMSYEHMCTYQSEDGRLGICDHTPAAKNGGFRKGYSHWRIDNNIYKTKEKFLEALKDFNPNTNDKEDCETSIL